MFKPTRTRLVAALSTAFVAIVLAVVPVMPASAGTAISGTITCLNNPSPVGVWVDAQSSTSGWAAIAVPIRLGGFSQVTYKYTLNKGGNFRVNVGCGGTPQRWGQSLSSGYVSGSVVNFRCNDIPPLLAKAWRTFGGIWGKAVDLSQGIAYGTCKQV